MSQITDKGLDRLSKGVIRAGGITGEEVGKISSSPFLHARLRARIDAERQRRAEQGTGWTPMLLVASRAIAALLLITIAAFSAFWVSKVRPASRGAVVSKRAEDIDRVIVGGTCALSTTEECAISTEEVLATMFAEEGGKER